MSMPKVQEFELTLSELSGELQFIVSVSTLGPHFPGKRSTELFGYQDNSSTKTVPPFGRISTGRSYWPLTNTRRMY